MDINIGFFGLCAVCAGFYAITECVKHVCNMRAKNVENKAKMKFMDNKFVDAVFKEEK
jgi:hypothetical protein